MDNRLPKHVAIIMDGNGRWAKKQGKMRTFGHKAGVETVRKIVRESGNLGIEVLTLYTFSTENWARPDEEVGFLMNLLLHFFQKEVDELNRENVSIRILGEMDGFPEKLRKVMDGAVKRTKDNTGLILALALNYGGQDEILMAARACADELQSGKIKEITKEAFASHLYTAGFPPLDLLIRTSGEIRLSNFLLWQCAYAEFVFVDTLWPDFDETEYHKALEEYGRRKRRFGKV